MRVILASASKRRRTLLKRIIPHFQVIPPYIREKSIKGQSTLPHQYVCKLARIKALKVASKLKKGLVIGADTVVYGRGQIIGKPQSRSDARTILEKLSGTKHSVITGVCVIDVATRRAVSDYAKTTLRMKKLTPDGIASIVKSSKHYDKAGGYAIQEQRDRYIKIIKGRMDNAVGLPLNLVQRLIKRLNLSVR